MKIKLGYVAISLTIDTIILKTTTYTNYQKLNEKEKITKLDNIINQNFKSLKDILTYNFKNDIHFYRLSSNIIPLATHPNVNIDYIKPYRQKWEHIGYMTKLYNIRVDTHPDHFCILNSPNKEVINQSIQILNYHKNIFKAMKINGKVILHIGGMYNDKNKSIERFISNFKKLKPELKKMITLENDDKTYNIKDTLYVCKTLNIPMVLDYHHYKCNNEGEKIEDYLPQIIDTWKDEKLNPKMHFSSPKNKNKKAHSNYINAEDFIKFIDILKPLNKDIDIMLECKNKDEALFKLVRELKYKTNYTFINQTTIKIN